MKLLSVEAAAAIINKHGFERYITDLMDTLEDDFGRWESFTKMPRPAMHVPGGVLELMPICDDRFYSFKYVNCHPKNPEQNLQTVIATGQLSRVDTGYPVLFSEMTLLTALRTAATSALVTKYMARKNAKVLAIIGTGAQSEFQVRAHQLVRDIVEVRYFDIDRNAMKKFADNFKGSTLKFVPCRDVEEAVSGADIVITCTACKAHVDVVRDAWIKPGVHINALGGDTIGKTELEEAILRRSRIVVEYFDQSFIEGEIQRFTEKEARERVLCEMAQIVRREEQGRLLETDITLFDSVGIGLEDYSVLRLTYELSKRYKVGIEEDFTPVLQDPKNLISLL